MERIKNENLGYKDIFNIGFELYLKNIKWICVLVLMVMVPTHLIEYVTNADSIRWEFSESLVNNSLGLMNTSSMYMLLGVQLVISLVLYPLLDGGFARLADVSADEGKGSFGDLMAGSLEIIYKLVPTAILYFIIVTAGTMLFIVPGLYFLILFSFANAAVAVTGKWGYGALKESAWVVRGQMLRAVGLYALSYGFMSFLSYFLGFFVRMLYNIVPDLGLLALVLDILLEIPFMYFNFVIALWFVNQHYFRKKLFSQMNPPRL